MKEFFSKILNWVTISCILVWFCLIGIAFAYPENIDRVFELSEKLIYIIFGSLVGAGGVKVKQAMQDNKETIEPTDPILGADNVYD